MRQTFGLKARIVIGAHPALFREGLRKLLEAGRQFLVVHDAGTAHEVLERTKVLQPDVLILDLALRDVPGDSLSPVGYLYRPPAVIGLTASISEDTTSIAVRLHARGLVLKDSDASILVRAVRAVWAGEDWLDRERVSNLAEALHRRCGSQTPPKLTQRFRLTERECEIVSAVASAYANKDIAQRLAISETTVKHHLTRIFDKTGVTSRLELGMLALSHGFRP